MINDTRTVAYIPSLVGEAKELKIGTPAELVAYLARAAHGDESQCPSDVDVVWYTYLVQPEIYEAFCIKNFGVLIEYVVIKPGECHARRSCRARIRQPVRRQEVHHA